MSSVNWSGSPKNCQVMSKLVKKCREKQVACPIYKQILSTCKQKVYKELVRTHYGKSNISSER